MELGRKRGSIKRETVDLNGYPDLVAIYLGMRVKSIRGMLTLLRFRSRINQAIAANPEGMLLHENLIYGLFPPHFGMRQYWRDFDALECWARSLPHQGWWKAYMTDTEGTGFWHETYFIRGGFEAVYDEMPGPLGLMRFAPVMPAHGAMFSARQRLRLKGDAPIPAPVGETEQ